ncbi:MAG: hypothetical protein P1V36_04400 [Planctomycetota bacterium]|nr:hypothetical protein [Planctomycetota bacterium]
MKLTTLVSLLALGTAVGAGAFLYQQNTDLKDRLAALETVAGTADPAGGDPAAPGPGLQGASARREMAELKGTTNALMARMETVEANAKAAAASRADGPALDAGALASKPGFGEAVRDVVLDMAKNDVDFRSRLGNTDRTKIPKNAPFTRVAETLQLDASQEAAMGKDLQEIQGELFALLAEERDDGVVPMELIAKAEEMKEGDPRRGELFIKLFTLKIPGGDETYMQRAIGLTQTFRKKADKYLRTQQKEILNSVEIDWFSIKFD